MLEGTVHKLPAKSLAAPPHANVHLARWDVQVRVTKGITPLKRSDAQP